MFIATINVPGYLPMDDEPPTFETAREAWQFLAGERKDSEDDRWDGITSDYSPTFFELERHASPKLHICDFERAGTVYGPTPGYEGDHDLGLAYSVSEVE